MRRPLLVLVLIGVLTAVLAGPASARSGTPLGYSISAVGFRSYFFLHSQPGRTLHASLQIVNLGSTPRTIVLAPADVSTANAGELQYGDTTPKGEGRWLALSAARVALPAGGTRRLPFTVRIPGHAGPGDHFAAITAVDRRVLERRRLGRGAIRLRLIPRLAMTVRVAVPGARRRELQVTGARVAVAPSGAALALRIANPGNALIDSARGSLTVSQGDTDLFSQSIELGPFVPRTAITFDAPWIGRPVEGTYQVKGELRPRHAPPIHFSRTVHFRGRAIQQFRRQTGRPATARSGAPVALILLLVIAVAAALAFAVAYANLRRNPR
jgi:hypothetical protein